MGNFSEVIKRRILREISDSEQDIWMASFSYLNNTGWELSWGEKDNKFSLYASNHLIFTSDDWLIIQSFVYGLVHSTLRISFRMRYGSKPSTQKLIYGNVGILENYSIIDVFDELLIVNERLFEQEIRLAAVARANSMYRVY